MPIAVPPPNEQILILNKIIGIKKILSQFRANYLKLQKQKSGLMQDLLTGKVEVQVNEKESVNV